MQDFELIVVSNRAPFPGDPDTAGGGLVVTIKDSLAQRGGIWIAAKEKEEASRVPVREGLTEYHALPFMREQDAHYKFVNNWIWPLAHGVDTSQSPAITQDDIGSSKAVSRGFAREAFQFAEQSKQKGKTPILWVHDYQLMSVGMELRQMGYEGTIAFFLHIPVPGKADFDRLSPSDRKTIKAGYADMLAYDQIGFQTMADRAKFEQIALEFGARRTSTGLSYQGREIQLDTAPVGIDPAFYTDYDYTQPLSKAVKKVDHARSRRNLIAAVGRVDPIKMQNEVLTQYAEMLKADPALGERAFYAMIGADSRGKVALNAKYIEATHATNDALQAAYKDQVDKPVQLFGGIDRGEMRPLLRLLSVLHVPSRRDGFNLTAVEGVAAADPFDPSALVISKYIGAATGLTGAISYDPFDPDAMERSLKKGLAMEIPERRERWETNMDFVRANTAERWFDSLLGKMEELETKRLQQPAYDPAKIGSGKPSRHTEPRLH